MSFILEIAVFNIESALLAAKAGADRLELCENPTDGGTTPSYGTLKIVREMMRHSKFKCSAWFNSNSVILIDDWFFVKARKCS